jgi:hypothetical protein
MMEEKPSGCGRTESFTQVVNVAGNICKIHYIQYLSLLEAFSSSLHARLAHLSTSTCTVKFFTINCGKDRRDE